PQAPPQLVDVAGVGSGFDQRSMKAVWDRLQDLRRDTPPFAERTPKAKGHHWVEPRLVCEVRFTECTEDGGLRHPTYLGLRDDVPPEHVVRENAPAYPASEGSGRVAEPAPADPTPNGGRRAGRARPAPAGPPAGEPVQPPNLKEAFRAEDRLTQGD